MGRRETGLGKVTGLMWYCAQSIQGPSTESPNLGTRRLGWTTAVPRSRSAWGDGTQGNWHRHHCCSVLGCVVGTQPSREGQGRLPGGSKSTTVIVTITLIPLTTCAEYSLCAGQGIKHRMGYLSGADILLSGAVIFLPSYRYGD